MDIDRFQPPPTTNPVQRPPVQTPSRQAVTGLTPPQRAEALIREVRPSVAAHPRLSAAARMLIGTMILAPFGWLLLSPLLLGTMLFPFLCRRYTLTNRRLMVRRGRRRRWPQPIQEIALADIDDVRLDPASRNAFYRSATLEILSQGKTALRLPGVPQPEAFRHAVLNAVRAWAPGKLNGPFVPASAKTGDA